jgi:hypothetical protein
MKCKVKISGHKHEKKDALQIVAYCSVFPKASPLCGVFLRIEYLCGRGSTFSVKRSKVGEAKCGCFENTQQSGQPFLGKSFKIDSIFGNVSARTYCK